MLCSAQPFQDCDDVLQVGRVCVVVTQDVIRHLAGLGDSSECDITSAVELISRRAETLDASLEAEPAPRGDERGQVL